MMKFCGCIPDGSALQALALSGVNRHVLLFTIEGQKNLATKCKVHKLHWIRSHAMSHETVRYRGDTWQGVCKGSRLGLRSWTGLVTALLVWTLAVSACRAQDLRASAPAQFTNASTRVEQHVFLDPSRALSLADIPADAFKPFTPLQRLPMAGKTVWLRLSFARPDREPVSSETTPLFLKLLPPMFESVVLHTPDAQAKGGWRATHLGDLARSRVIPVGELAKSGLVFLQINASHANGLVAFAGTQEEVLRYNHLLDIAVAMVSTLLLFAWMGMLWKVFTQFNHLSLAASVFFPFVLLRIWLTLGYGPVLLGLSPAWVNQLYVPAVSAHVLITGGFFILLAAEVFQSARWFAWMRSWVALAACNLVLSFFQPDWAIWIIDGLMLGGALMLMVCLMLAAVRTPQNLATWPARIAFLILVLVTGMGLLSALHLQGFSPSADPLQRPDALQYTLLLRALMPIALIGIASWTYERLRSDRFNHMQTDLVDSAATLELESKRLERQRNFTAMLAHELKNPLTASHMALSGIEARLGAHDPLRDRADTIKTSLQEINAIIERCAEIDGYEQGQMPLAIHRFSIRQLMVGVKASNPSERIYTALRGVNEDALLSSDMQYIKIILNNLLSNALKYSPADSLVGLEIKFHPDSLVNAPSGVFEFIVSNDMGAAGVPETQRLFERFYRAEAARNQSGAGLGLWLAQSLAHALSTEVLFQCDEERVFFRFQLPAL